MAGALFERYLRRTEKYDGTIYLIPDGDKTVYSLELDDVPDTIKFKKRLSFKVDASVQSSIRD